MLVLVRENAMNSSDIEKVLGYCEAEHVVESVVELKPGGATPLNNVGAKGDGK